LNDVALSIPVIVGKEGIESEIPFALNDDELKKLRESGHILVDEFGHISLTDDGREIAERIYERHTFLSQWLESMGVPPEIAAEDACRMEHVVSNESFEAIRRFAGK